MLAVSGTLTVLTIALRGFVVPLRALAAITGLSATGSGLTAVAGGVGALTRLGGLIVLGASLLRVASGIGAILTVLKLGSDAETPQNRDKLDEIARQNRAPGTKLSDGFDESGKPIGVPAPKAQRNSGVPFSGTQEDVYHHQLPPAYANTPPLLEAADKMADKIAAAVKAAVSGMTVNMDGKKVGDMVSNHQADQASRPLSGSSQPDLRMSPLNPGMPGGWLGAP